MKLELADFPVKQIRLGNRFKYESEFLEVDEGELIALVLEDTRITDATLAVAVPGEKTRITGIRDMVEPRFKVAGSGQVFPGVLGAVENVGDGRTHRLSGMTVIAAAEYEGTIRAGTTVQRNAILDMSGPGAEISRFSSCRHLVLSFRIAPGLGELDAHGAIQSAEYKVAQRLGQVTAELSPVEIATYDLTKKDPALPNVMLVQGCITDPQHVHSGVGYYGLSLRNSMSTFVSGRPAEDRDGRRRDVEALHAPLQLPALLGRRSAVHARSRTARDRSRRARRARAHPDDPRRRERSPTPSASSPTSSNRTARRRWRRSAAVRSR